MNKESVEKWNLLKKINPVSDDNLMVYGFWGAIIAVLIGAVIILPIFSAFDNRIILTNSLINSIFDALKLFLTSVSLGCILNYVRKRMVSRKRIIGLMTWLFIGYLAVDTMGLITSSLATTQVSHSKTFRKDKNIDIDINKDRLIIKGPNSGDRKIVCVRMNDSLN